MSSDTTLLFPEAELESFRAEVFRNTSLVQSLSRVVFEFFIAANNAVGPLHWRIGNWTNTMFDFSLF